MSKYNHYPLPLRLLRTIFPIIEKLFPFLSKKIAYRFFFIPLSYDYPSIEKPYLEKAEISNYTFGSEILKIYQWGNVNSTKKVLLVHGWAGRATQFRKIIDALEENNIHIISYDAPGHGKSSGDRSNLPEMSKIISELNSKFSFDIIIGHSLGGAASIFSIVSLQTEVKKLILISAPSSSEKMMDDFMDKLNGGYKTKDYLRLVTKEHFGKELESFFAEKLLPNPNFPTTLVIHDKIDNEVSFEHSLFLQKNINNVQIVNTQNFGHTKILRNDKVLNSIKEFTS